MEEKVRFSQHAKTRFRERFIERIEEVDNNLLLALCKVYYKSEIDNSIKNDTNFMTYVYEKHGYDDYTFSVFEDIIFVVKNLTLVTVLPTESYAGQRLTQRSTTFRKNVVHRERHQRRY